MKSSSYIWYISIPLITGNISIVVLGPGYFFVGGPHNMAASRVSVPTGLQLTYINRWIRTLPTGFVIATSLWEFATVYFLSSLRAGVLLSPPSINCPAGDLWVMVCFWSLVLLCFWSAVAILIQALYFLSCSPWLLLIVIVISKQRKRWLHSLSFRFAGWNERECDDASNASSWDFDMTLDSPRSKSIDNNRQELCQPPCAASPGGTRTMNIGIIKHSIPVPQIMERTR